MKPGETDTLVVTLGTKGRFGDFSRKVRVTTNDPNQPSVVLNGVSKVLAPMKMTPRSVRFMRLKPDAMAQHGRVRIDRGDGGPLNPKLLPITDDNVEAILKEVTPGEQYELLVTVNPPWPETRQRTVLNFDTGVEAAPRDSVSVFVAMMPAVEASPQRLTFYRDDNQDATHNLRMIWNRGEPKMIRSARCLDPRVSVEVTGDDPMSQRIAVTWPAGYVPAKRATKLTISTGDPNTPTVNVSIVWVDRALNQKGSSSRTLKPMNSPGVKPKPNSPNK